MPAAPDFTVSPASRLRAALCSPLLPYWLVVALLPFGRSAELGTALCLLGTLLLFARHPGALREHAGARLLLWLLGAYVLAALISCFGAVAPARSWTVTASLLRYAPLGLYACYAMRREAALHRLFHAVAWLLAFWTLDAWMQALTGYSLAGHAQAVRLTGIFGADDPKLGPVLAVLSPFALWAARARFGRLGLLLAFVGLLVPILLAGSRAAWLCYALVAVAFALREAHTPRRAWALLALGAVTVILAMGVSWSVSPRFHARMERSLALFNGTEQGVDTAVSGRLDIWRASMRMVAAHPFDGVGVRGFRYAYPRFAPATDHFVVAESCGVGEGACHAHQIVLEVLTETGAVGLVLWLAAVVLAVRAWRRVGTAARARAFPATVALGVMLFPLNTHLAFYSAWWGLLFAWLLGLWCAALYVLPDQAGIGDGA